MNKKTMKIIGFLAIVLFTIMSIVPVFAVDTNSILDNIDGSEIDDSSQITSIGGKIVSVITTIGIVVAVAVLVVLGIKYMMGSAEEKAEYKKTLIPYFIGALLIFSASAIVKVISSIQF